MLAGAVSDTGAVDQPDPEGAGETPGSAPDRMARESSAVKAEIATPPRSIAILDGPTEGTIRETLIVAMVRW